MALAGRTIATFLASVLLGVAIPLSAFVVLGLTTVAIMLPTPPAWVRDHLDLSILAIELFAWLPPVLISGFLIRQLASSHAAAAKPPNLNGVWTRTRSVTPKEPLPLNKRGLALREAIDESLTPIYDCVPETVPHILGDPYNFSFEQLNDRVIQRFEKDATVRTLWLEGHGNRGPSNNDYGVHGYSMAHYAEFYDFEHLLVLGRVTSGSGGEIIVGTAREVLATEFPELRIQLHLPDEKEKRHGQAIAAASLPVVVK